LAQRLGRSRAICVLRIDSRRFPLLHLARPELAGSISPVDELGGYLAKREVLIPPPPKRTPCPIANRFPGSSCGSSSHPLSLLKSDTGDRSVAKTPPGRFFWDELHTSEPTKALVFHEKVLGFSVGSAC
jgi:hypothetical protein